MCMYKNIHTLFVKRRKLIGSLSQHTYTHAYARKRLYAYLQICKGLVAM